MFYIVAAHCLLCSSVTCIDIGIDEELVSLDRLFITWKEESHGALSENSLAPRRGQRDMFNAEF